MKHLIYLSLCLFFLSCDKQFEDLDDLPPDKGLSVAAARVYFSRYDKLLGAATRSNVWDSLLTPGGFEVKWERAVLGSNGERSVVEIPILATKFFRGVFVDGSVPVKQRLLVVRDDTVCMAYITTIVPTAAYFVKRSDYDSHFTNLGVGGDFTGYVLFHTLMGDFVQVIRMDDGRLVDSYFTSLLTDANVDVVRQGVFRVLGGLRFYRESISTRGGDDPPFDGGNIDPVVVRYCKKCKKPIEECSCSDPWFDEGVGNMPTDIDRNIFFPPYLGGGGGGNNPPPKPPEEPKPDETKKPCNTGASTSQANPLFKMLPSPSSEGNDKGGLFGLTRTKYNSTTGKSEPKFHGGIDLAAEPGTPIYSMFAGKVTKVVTNQVNREEKTRKYPPGYTGDINSAGNRITIESVINGVTVSVSYFHLHENKNRPPGGLTRADENTRVEKGQRIGYTGITGNANEGYTKHLHVQVTENGKSVNPQKYLNATVTAVGKKVTITTPCD